MCFEKDKTCNPDECKFAKGHFDRVNDAIYELITKEDNVSRETIEKYAKKHEVCPFEFSLDLSIWADGIICDYNYVFDPQAKLKRFFFEEKNKYIYLIDEAHNLVDRAREMFSAELFKRDILDMKRLFKDIEPKISKILDRINREFLKLKKLCKDKDYHIQKEEVEDIYYPLKKFIKLADNWLIENGDKKEHADLLDLYFKIVSFLRVSEDYSEKFVTYIERKDKDILVKLFCLDPSYLLSNTLNSGLSAILFSATLSPMEYFKDILGGSKDDNMMKLESPFDRENLKVVIEDKISTKYRNRKYSYEKLADKIYQASKYKKGNYMAFFPSYKYMQDVYEVFIERYSNIATIIQFGGMKEEEREEFLNKFIDKPKETLVSFAVMGGIFSEGIDLKGERLTGAIVVGVGLPKICLERNIIRDYFNEKNGLGYEYAYMYPGMNKVLQAAGRVIRTENDKGIVCLIDERFSYKSYKDIFPPHLR
ncbi:ATP-dependent DNA helicase [Senegalia sp. (in: firmicutes)]|uniref:ATP-dependent DNA helicase n=1 Tax=Senegalia sp. (in: firmicutes) TaxID=1924098 RepID=UPI003F950FA9